MCVCVCVCVCVYTCVIHSCMHEREGKNHRIWANFGSSLCVHVPILVYTCRDAYRIFSGGGKQAIHIHSMHNTSLHMYLIYFDLT